MNRHLRLVPSAAAIGLGLVLLTPAVASAHIEPDVGEVPAGESATVAFNLEHGCEDAATTELEMQVPAEVTDAQPVDKPGWTASEADGVITFSGGSQPSDQSTDFSISFTAPDQPGTELRFPIIQTCGSEEVAWISESEDDEHPAPVVLVGEAGSAPVTEGEHDDGEDEATTAPPATTSTDTGTSEDDDSAVPFILGGIAAIAIVGGVVYAIRRRRPS